MKSSIVVVIAIAVALASCANLNSVHRTLDTSNGQGVLIDIKQRAILASKSGEKSVVCAEPSPDSLSAYAFDLAAEGSLPGKALSGTLGSAESAAFVGLRSQSIQLLRDQFFRACEAYMNQAISAADYNLLIRRYQKQTAALLAIEQLTSVVTAPAAVVSAAGSAHGSAISFLRSLYDENQTKVKSLEKDRDVSGISEEQKKKLQAEIDRLNKQNTEIVDSIKGALPAKVVTTASGTLTPPVNPTPKEIETVSEAVANMVEQITQADDFIQLCIIWLGASDTSLKAANSQPAAPLSSDMRNACVARMQVENDRLKVINLSAETIIKIAAEDKKSESSARIDKVERATKTVTGPGYGVKTAKPDVIDK